MPRLLIIQDFLRHGGTESHAVWLAGALRADGVDATLLTFRPGGPLAPRAREAGIPMRALQPFDLKLDWLAPNLAHTARDMNPDAVLLMGKLANSAAPSLKRALPRARIVGSVRTGHPLPWFVRRALPHCDAVVSNARTIADTLPPFGVRPEAITVIPNPPVLPVLAADPGRRAEIRAAHGVAPGETVLLCVAGFRPGKGQDELIRTLAATPADAGIRLWLAGDGETRRDCEALAAALGVAARVSFLGHTGDPRPLYLAADVAVMASAAEALPNFLVEAQLHGLPVAARDAGGVKETFAPGVSGILTPPGDAKALAQAWCALADDTPTRMRQGEAARLRAPGIFSRAAALAAYRRVFGF